MPSTEAKKAVLPFLLELTEPMICVAAPTENLEVSRRADKLAYNALTQLVEVEGIPTILNKAHGTNVTCCVGIKTTPNLGDVSVTDRIEDY